MYDVTIKTNFRFKPVEPIMVKSMRESLIYISGVSRRRFLSGKPLKVRSGRLRNSLKVPGMEGIFKIVRSAMKILGRLGTRVPYGPTHEYGATIKPIRSQWLTIPLQAVKTRAGVARGRARDFTNTFFRRSKTGNLILFQKRGKGIVPLFVLKKQVKIPKRAFLEPAVKKSLGWITDRFSRNIAEGAVVVK